jgi:hypothetical protein
MDPIALAVVGGAAAAAAAVVFGCVKANQKKPQSKPKQEKAQQQPKKKEVRVCAFTLAPWNAPHCLSCALSYLFSAIEARRMYR